MNNLNIIEKIKENLKEWRIEEFERQVWELSDTRTIENLRLLLKLFEDYNEDYPDIDVLYSIVHAVEKYPDEIYVRTLLEELPDLMGQSPFWTDCLFNRVLNDKNCHEVFEQNIHLAKKEDLLKLFKLIEKESPHHKEYIEYLKNKILI